MLKRWLINAMLLLVSLVLLYALGEGVVRAAQYMGWAPLYSSKSIPRNQTPNPQFNARLLRSDNPRLFIEFDRQDRNINSAGFRGAEWPAAKDAAVYRIAVLGDSVAYGYSVALEETFPRRLEALLRQQGFAVEVLNFAVNGYGTAAQAELLHTHVMAYQPDMVLLAYVLNDPVPPQVLMETVGSAMRATASLDRLARKTQFGAWLWLRWLAASRAVLGGMDMYRPYYRKTEYWQPVVSAVQEMQQLTGQHGVPLVAAVFPLFRDFERYPLDYAHAQAGALLTALEVPYIDLLAHYRHFDHRRFMLIPVDDTHPNAAGHQLAADVLADFLRPWLADRAMPAVTE